MLDSIYVGMSGLQGFSTGLRVVANNTANINTPGFKGSSLQFGDLFYERRTSGDAAVGSPPLRLGRGVDTFTTTLDLRQGDSRQTGNDLDVSIDGEGFFTVRSSDGELQFTRDGEFIFDGDGVLVTRSDGAKVMGRDPDGGLTEIKLEGRWTSAAKATDSVTFRGNLSMTATEKVLNDVKLTDHAGKEHVVTVKLTNAGASKPGGWKVVVLDGTRELGNGDIEFFDGKVRPGQSGVTFEFTKENTTPFEVLLDFTGDVTSFASSDTSTLAMLEHSGRAAGGLTRTTFDGRGELTLAYSNGDAGRGPMLALARFDSPDSIVPFGASRFTTARGSWKEGGARDDGFGAIRTGSIEGSNVDLSGEFSDLVILQRGYQASSQIISTASEMLQELFSMKRR